MTPLQTRFAAMVAKLGEDFEISGDTGRGIFGILPPSVAGRYVTQSVLDFVARPIRSVYVDASDGTDESDIMDWNGADWTVRRVVPIRHAGQTVGKLLVITEGV